MGAQRAGGGAGFGAELQSERSRRWGLGAASAEAESILLRVGRYGGRDQAGLEAQPWSPRKTAGFSPLQGRDGAGPGAGFQAQPLGSRLRLSGVGSGAGPRAGPILPFDSCLSHRLSRVGLRTCGPALCASPSPRGPSPGHEAYLFLLQFTSGGRCQMCERRSGAGVQVLC